MHETLDRARRQRKQLGDLLLMLQLLHPWLNKAFLTRGPPAVFYTYAGFDLMAKWAKYLLDDLRPYNMHERLSEAFSVKVDEVECIACLTKACGNTGTLPPPWTDCCWATSPRLRLWSIRRGVGQASHIA